MGTQLLTTRWPSVKLVNFPEIDRRACWWMWLAEKNAVEGNSKFATLHKGRSLQTLSFSSFCFRYYIWIEMSLLYDEFRMSSESSELLDAIMGADVESNNDLNLRPCYSCVDVLASVFRLFKELQYLQIFVRLIKQLTSSRKCHFPSGLYVIFHRVVLP